MKCVVQERTRGENGQKLVEKTEEKEERIPIWLAAAHQAAAEAVFDKEHLSGGASLSK